MTGILVKALIPCVKGMMGLLLEDEWDFIGLRLHHVADHIGVDRVVALVIVDEFWYAVVGLGGSGIQEVNQQSVIIIAKLPIVVHIHVPTPARDDIQSSSPVLISFLVLLSNDHLD